MNGKLEMWKARIKTNLHGQDVPYDIYFTAAAVLKADLVYKQSRNYHPQLYVIKKKYADTERQQCNMQHYSDKDGFIEL